MGECHSLSMRGCRPSVLSQKPQKSSAPTEKSAAAPRRIARKDLFLSDSAFLGEASASAGSAPLTFNDKASPKVDKIDKIVWAGEALALTLGTVLIARDDNRWTRGLGWTLIGASGENITLEISDRIDKKPHATRNKRMILSLVAGLFVGGATLLISDFSPSGVGSGDPGRNPSEGFGP